MSNDIFYFVVYTKKKTAVTVIDLAHAVSYERGDWWAVNEINMHDSNEAILYARDLAGKHNLNYEPFESRYDKSLNETGFIY